MSTTKMLIQQLQQGEKKALARCITIVENELEGYEEILTSLKYNQHHLLHCMLEISGDIKLLVHPMVLELQLVRLAKGEPLINKVN